MNPLPLRQIPVVNLVYAARRVVNPKLTYEYLAKKCGVSRPLVSMWFSGARDPNEKQAEILAREMCCELDLIWAKAGTMEEAMEMALESSEEAIGRSSDTAEAVTPVTDAIAPLIPKQRRLRLVDDIDPSLELIESIEPGDDQIEIGLYPESVAATQLDRLDPDSELRKIWIPARLRKVQGAKLRAVEVSGYSMNKAGFIPKAIAFFVMKTRHKDGSIAIVEEHGGVTLKRVRGQRAVAESDRVYNDIMLGEDARHVGTVVAIWLPK